MAAGSDDPPAGASGYLAPRVNLIVDAAAAAAACAALSGSSVLAVDLEGVNLGRDGTVTLVLLCAGDGVVHCFDVLALGAPAAFAALGCLLTSPHICKLCYDCRGDADALLHRHGVRMQAVYDLQIAYTLLYQSPRDPFLKGLHRALEAPGVLPGALRRGVTACKRRHKELLHAAPDLFARRPLSAEALRYCAGDVAPLFRMYALWGAQVHPALVLHASAARQHAFCARRAPPPPPQMACVDFARPPGAGRFAHHLRRRPPQPCVYYPYPAAATAC